jgi:ribosome biogenesis GTPase
MPEVLVIKRVGGLYELLDHQGERFTGKSRGKNKESGILIGDWVFLGDEQMIERVLPRKNQLIRPPLANVDQQVLVFTLNHPPLHRDLLEKMLLQGELAGIHNVIVLQKADRNDPQQAHILAEEYRLAGYPVVQTSAYEATGLEELHKILHKKISVFAGPSGVGKSSLLNALFPNYHLETGALSEKIQRGKHTTRHAELYGNWEKGLIADTPGFYKLESPFVEPRSLAETFPEMRSALGNCRFISCIHDKEPDCAIKALLTEGTLSTGRYETYLQLLHEMQERERGQYQ